MKTNQSHQSVKHLVQRFPRLVPQRTVSKSRFRVLAVVLACAVAASVAPAQVIVQNLGLACDQPGEDAFGGLPLLPFTFDGRLVAFLMSESGQSTDLNRDGDLSDSVLHVYDTANETVHNLAPGRTGVLPVTREVTVTDGLVTFPVYEYDLTADLNGDGDTLDAVIHVFHADSGVTRNIGLAAGFGGHSPLAMTVNDHTVAFLVAEYAQGNSDLNGDGDADDMVLHLYRTDTQQTVNLGVAVRDVPRKLNDHVIAFRVEERSQGDTDLNGDGDTFDQVLHVHDTVTGVTDNLGIAVRDISDEGPLSPPLSPIVIIGGDQLAFAVSESNGLYSHSPLSAQNNTDLNGDGDTADVSVIHIYDASTHLVSNLGLAGGIPLGIGRTFRGNRLGDFLPCDVSESSQGTDLNGDGDTADTAVHVYDASSGQVTNLGLAGEAGPVRGELISFVAFETSQGSDLNGDGDMFDSVSFVYDASTGDFITTDFNTVLSDHMAY